MAHPFQAQIAGFTADLSSNFAENMSQGASWQDALKNTATNGFISVAGQSTLSNKLIHHTQKPSYKYTPELTEGANSYISVSPKNPEIKTQRFHQVLPSRHLPETTINEASLLLTQNNPDIYPTPEAAKEALEKTQRTYIIRDAEYHVSGVATLTPLETGELYLGQVAGRKGTGQDVMQRILQDTQRLSETTKPIRIVAHASNPSNIIKLTEADKTPFYAGLGATISAINTTSEDGISIPQGVDFYWQFPEIKTTTKSKQR